MEIDDPDKTLEASYVAAINAIARERDQKMQDYGRMIEILHRRLDDHRAAMRERQH